jgi:hypothetical protein
MTKEFEETLLNDTKQMAELFEEIENYKDIIKNKDTDIEKKDIEIKTLKDENKLLKEKIIILKEVINKNDNKNKFHKEFKQEPVDNNIIESPLPNPEASNINAKETKYITKEDILKDIPEIPIKNEDNKTHLPNNFNSNEKAKKNTNDTKMNNNIPTPSSSSENIKNNDDNIKNVNSTTTSRHKFSNKSLPILERCNVLAYKYNKTLDKVKNKNELQILHFISSEHKLLISFNSSIAEQVSDNKDLWEQIYKFKVENGELKDTSGNKTQFKYKVMRCKELYDKYGESLDRFQIYVNYLGRLTPVEWNKYLEEFDKLYRSINLENICQYKYKSGKNCGRIDCSVKHKENK